MIFEKINFDYTNNFELPFLNKSTDFYKVNI